MRLGFIDNTEIMGVRTDAPWTLPVDAVVVPVESLYSGQARTMVDRLGLDEERVRLATARTEDAPVPVRLTSGGEDHRLVVFVTDPGFDAEGKLTDQVIRAALDSAHSESARSVAIPVGLARHFGVDLLRAVSRHVHDMNVRLWNSPTRIVLFHGHDDTEQTMFDNWLDLLDEKPFGAHEVASVTRMLGGVSSDLVAANKTIDTGQDALGVAVYSAMLASMIAGDDTPLPLSVGVFGEWGAGKSFFMGLMRDEINRLSGVPGYCDRVVQIGFNAWHYADTDLWASLADVIFRDLERAVAGTPGDPRSEIKERLIDKIDHRAELRSTAAAATATASRLQAEIDGAAEKHVATTRDLLTAIRSSPLVRARFDQTWQELGVVEEVDQARLLSAELRQAATDVGTIRGMTADRVGRMALGAAAGLLVLSVLLVVLHPVAGVVSGAVAVASGLFGGQLLTRVRAGLGHLRELSTELRAGLEAASEQRMNQGITQQLDQLRKVEFDQRVAERQLAEVVDEVADLSARLAELHPARRMSAFLADRAHGDRYTRGLGTVSTVRKDFEELVDLLAQWRADPGDSGARPIDRVVLYIDDLDRCAPRQVVRVLEAVHLMLALDLFVVVIGVDPRWLLRSLSSHYSELLDGSGDGGDGSRTGNPWHVAPEDYLEKIINIPFTLPAMSARDVDRLLLSTLDVPPMPPMRKSGRPYHHYRGGDGGEPPTGPQSVAITVEPGADLDLTVLDEPQRLTVREMDFCAEVGSLVRTPRAAKRFFNIYRMIRATRNLSDPASFLGTQADPGQFRIVIVLLAVVAAAPRLARNLLARLDDTDGITPWRTFVADLGDLSGDSAWLRLHRDLLVLSERLDLPPVQELRYWLATVRRFSYLGEGG